MSSLYPIIVIFPNLEISKEYSKFFCSDKYYVSFVVGNQHEDSININVFCGDSIIKQESCIAKNEKIISFVVNSDLTMSEFTLDWEFVRRDNVRGKISLDQIFKKFSFKFQNSVNIINYRLNLKLMENMKRVNLE
jgi:hypothetical protein